MPELPDVQVFKEYVDATSLHQRILAVHVDAAGLRETVSPATLRRRLRGRRLESARRHGKHLFVEVEGDGWLRLHFGMSGGLAYYKDADPPDHARLVLDFPDDYHLAFTNVRKLGQIGFVDDPPTFIRNRGMGPDALDLDLEGFRERLAGRRGSVKGTLMNQEVLAGLGNEYTDEILFQAGLHPETPVDELDDRSEARLFRAMRRVLSAAIDARADPDRLPGGFLLPRRAEGASCPRCGGEIERIEVGGRPTYLCPHDQPVRESA